MVKLRVLVARLDGLERTLVAVVIDVAVLAGGRVCHHNLVFPSHSRSRYPDTYADSQ